MKIVLGGTAASIVAQSFSLNAPPMPPLMTISLLGLPGAMP